MAYFDPEALAAPVPARAGLSGLLGPTERRVLHLARRDPAASLGPPSIVQRLALRLFGGRRVGPLACPRLEALRRYAVLLHRSGRIPAEETRRLADAGFGAAAISLVRAQVEGWSAPRRVPRLRLVARLTVTADCLAPLGTAWLEGGAFGVAATLALPLVRRISAT